MYFSHEIDGCEHVAGYRRIGATRLEVRACETTLEVSLGERDPLARAREVLEDIVRPALQRKGGKDPDGA